MPAPDLRPVPLPCVRKSCGAVLGRTTPHVLHLSDAVQVTTPTRLTCRKCGASRKWRPVGDGDAPPARRAA